MKKRIVALLMAALLAGLSTPARAADQPAVVEARYDGDVTVTVRVSAPVELTEGTFAIYRRNTAVTLDSVTDGGDGVYLLTTAARLDMNAAYKVKFNGKEYELTMPDQYANTFFESVFTYAGSDLGPTYTPERTTLRVWAPMAGTVTVYLYSDGDPAVQAKPVEKVAMSPDLNGTWVCTLSGDRNGTYYTFRVGLKTGAVEVCDPYARAVGINGKRAMILDLDATDPEGWDADADPNAGKAITDAVIYELHLRDLSCDESSGIENKGKFLGLAESGTVNGSGQATGLDHLKELGVTHVQLMPAFDFATVDEAKPDAAQYNWGYDPLNYNVPEGSYSTDPVDGAVRVREFKQMVKALHDSGISVVMDVVFNHVYAADAFPLNRVVPGYFTRPGSDGSGCGNDTASERAMVRKFIVDSVSYWAEEYHIDGFRFDLAGLLDTETINAVVEAVHADHPDVLLFGEGWTLETKPVRPEVSLTTQGNAALVPGFGFFNDTIRDVVRGSVFDQSPGFISGAEGVEAEVARCLTAAMDWSREPSQIINYISCHDNNTLMDRITLSAPEADLETRVRMNKLGAAINLMSQGVPFLQAGEEMLRSKPAEGGGFDDNSYKSPDAVNSLKWDALAGPEAQGTFDYYKGLIAFRKAHPALRLATSGEVEQFVTVLEDLGDGLVGVQIGAGVEGEPSGGLVLLFNAGGEEATVPLPQGNWRVYIDDTTAGTLALRTVSGTATLAPVSALVLGRDPDPKPEPEPQPEPQPEPEPEPVPVPEEPSNSGLIVGIVCAAAAAVGLVVVLVTWRKKK